MRTNDYLDALRARLSADSDYAVSQRLGMQYAQFRRYRKGGTFDNTMAARVAALLDIDPLEVIGDMELERAKTEAAREQWAKIMERFQRIAAAVAIGSIMGTTALAPQPANAAASLYYVKRRRSGSRI